MEWIGTVFLVFLVIAIGKGLVTGETRIPRYTGKHDYQSR